MARLTRVRVVGASSPADGATRGDPGRRLIVDNCQLAGASSQSGARLVCSADLITERIRHLESALCALIGGPGDGRQAAVGPERRRRPRACHIESRQQARREKVPDAALLLEPLPGGVLHYYAAQLKAEGFLVVSGGSVRALDHGRTAGGSTAGDFNQQKVDIPTRLTTAGERSPLKKRAHALTVRDPRSLRVLEELIEESQLGGAVRLIRLFVEMLERCSHTVTS